MTPNQFVKQIRELISKDDLDRALQILKQFFQNSHQLNEVLQQSARFERVKQQIRLGVINHTDATIDRNQIRMGLLELITELEEKMEVKVLKEEMQQAISEIKHKNILNDSALSAKGNIQIGDKTITQNADKIYNVNNIDSANFS